MALAIAAVLATSVTAVAVVLRGVDLLSGSSGTDRSSSDLVPLLFAIAALCSAGLLRVRSRTWAWVALVVAAGLAALEVVGVVRGWQALASPGAWPWLVVVAEAALLAASSVAAIYMTDPRPGQAAAWRLVRRIVVVPAFAALVVVAGWAVVGSFSAAAPPTAGIDPLRLSGRLCAAFVAVSALAGGLRDLLGPVRRARRRATTLRELPRALGDELLPTAAAMRRRGREAEQARLAADLHALVLPDLRRAAAAAEASGSGGATVAAGLRDVVDDVERLIHVRQSIVLEEYCYGRARARRPHGRFRRRAGTPHARPGGTAHARQHFRTAHSPQQSGQPPLPPEGLRGRDLSRQSWARPPAAPECEARGAGPVARGVRCLRTGGAQSA